MTVSPHDIARILSEALPHMQRYDEEIVVVKYGGHAMGQEDMAKSFARDIVLMEQTAINPVVVHGGGPQIGEMLKRLGIKSEFAGGLRVTGLAAVYASVFRTWLEDDDPGQARTMAALDRRLRRGESAIRNVEQVTSVVNRLATEGPAFLRSVFRGRPTPPPPPPPGQSSEAGLP